METVTYFIFLGPKITADGDWSHEIKGRLLLGRKALTNLDNIPENRDITLLSNINIAKALVFPAIMYGCESWTMKKADLQITDAFELWCWRRLKSPLNCKEIKPVNLKGNKPWIFIGRTDVEALVLWPPDVKSRLIGKDPDVGKDWGQEEKWAAECEVVGWHHCLDGHEFWQTLEDCEDREAWLAAVHGVAKSQTGLSNWTTTSERWWMWCCVLSKAQPD